LGSGEDFKQVVLFPGSLELSGMNAASGSFLLFQQIESDVTAYSQRGADTPEPFQETNPAAKAFAKPAKVRSIIFTD
jgi:hypothetical protein